MDNQQFKTFTHTLIISFLSILLMSCTQTGRYELTHDGMPTKPIDVSKIPNAKPKIEARSKYGNPETYNIRGKEYHVLKECNGYEETGMASWYGTKFHNHLTSNRERYDMFKMTAAHKTLPLPTYVKVTNLKNKKTIIVKVNDRGPFEKNRIIDLSYVAAKKLGVLAHGTAPVKIAAIDPIDYCAKPKPVIHIAKKKEQPLFIQVGAYKNRENAILIAQQASLKTKVPYLIETTTVNNQPIFRVKLGPVPTTFNPASLNTTAIQSVKS